MAIWLVILLGAVQGLTEFLPVSSSGHLLLLQSVFSGASAQENLYFDLALHVGSVFAVIVAYRTKILSLFQKGNRKKLLWLAIATLPAALVGALFESKITALFSGEMLLFGFLTTAFLLLVCEWQARRIIRPKPFTFRTALCMGLMQAVAVVPGLSRSGSTIFGGTLLGSEREEVADFSFLMSIPIILGGAAYSAVKGFSGGVFSGVAVETLPFSILALGALSAFVFASVSLIWAKKAVQRARYYGFALYLLGLCTLLVFFRYF